MWAHGWYMDNPSNRMCPAALPMMWFDPISRINIDVWNHQNKTVLDNINFTIISVIQCAWSFSKPNTLNLIVSHIKNGGTWTSSTCCQVVKAVLSHPTLTFQGANRQATITTSSPNSHQNIPRTIATMHSSATLAAIQLPAATDGTASFPIIP